MKSVQNWIVTLHKTVEKNQRKSESRRLTFILHQTQRNRILCRANTQGFTVQFRSHTHNIQMAHRHNMNAQNTQMGRAEQQFAQHNATHPIADLL